MILLAGGGSFAAYAESDIDSGIFPDPVFHNFVQTTYDTEDDDWLQDPELAEITSMDLRNLGISDLRGIEVFTSLQELNLENNNLTTLDISANTALVKLNLKDNDLTTLNISANTALAELNCRRNNLTTLDISAVPALKDAVINGTREESDYGYNIYQSAQGKLLVDQTVAIETGIPDVPIDAANFPDPVFLDFVKANFDKDGNSSLSFAEIYEVSEIDIFDKGITDLKGVEHFMRLERLRCKRNKLEVLDVSANTALKVLECSQNKLTFVDVSALTDLEELDYMANKLTFVDVSANLKLRRLSVNASITALDLSKNAELTHLYADFTTSLPSLDLSNNPKLELLRCGEGGYTSLDVSANTELITIDCADNKLTSLDLSKNKKLKKLYCSNNQLTSLDVSANTELEYLYCYENNFTELDIRNAPILMEIVQNGKYKVAQNRDGFTFQSYSGAERYDVGFGLNMKLITGDTSSGSTGGGSGSGGSGSSGSSSSGGGYSGGSGGGGGSRSGSGGGSGSGGKSAGTGTKNNTKTAGSEGTWKEDARGWWFALKDGSYPKNTWMELPNSNGKAWYAFDEDGYMRSGWFLSGGRWYYMSVSADASLGMMQTGWREIDQKWYYLEATGNSTHPQGALYVNEKTPDGYQVNANGEWVK